MTDYPKISVVTITYGHEKYISETLDGIFMQIYPGEIEVIVADDNSPDGTEKVISDYLVENKIASNFSINYIKHEINKGAPANFSWALEQTTGRYIALCEGDDYWTDPLKLQRQVVFLQKNKDYSLCFTAKSNINNKGIITSESRYGHQENWSADDVLDGGFIAGLQSIVSINLSKEFNNFCNKFPDRTGVDRLYTYFYGTKGKLKYIDENTAVYRVHEGGIWSQLSERQKIDAHVRQHVKFLQIIKERDSDFKLRKRNMFRLMVKDHYFQFFKAPVKTFENLFYISKTYKLSPATFLLAGKDYLSYYKKIIGSKFKSEKVLQKSNSSINK